jgi:hypothetical protein
MLAFLVQNLYKQACFADISGLIMLEFNDPDITINAQHYCRNL